MVVASETNQAPAARNADSGQQCDDMQIIDNGGLLIQQNDQGEQSALGYLFDFSGRGVYSPDGKIEISKERADAHNAALAQAEIEGLNQCQIGQRGTFYYVNGRVQTWTGALVSSRVSVVGNVISFRFGGKLFRGRLQKDADCFNFKRVA